MTGDGTLGSRSNLVIGLGVGLETRSLDCELYLLVD
jgi:hypothetical protein